VLAFVLNKRGIRLQYRISFHTRKYQLHQNGFDKKEEAKALEAVPPRSEGAGEDVKPFKEVMPEINRKKRRRRCISRIVSGSWVYSVHCLPFQRNSRLEAGKLREVVEEFRISRLAIIFDVFLDKFKRGEENGVDDA